MSTEIDLEQFIQVLDHALATDDPKVKKALKKFLFIAALALEGDPEPGPFTQMFEEMDDLRRRVRQLEQLQTDNQKLYDDYTWDYTNTTTATPQWIYSGSTTTSTSGVTTTITNPSTSSASILYGPGTCSGFGSTTFTIDLGDDDKGKRIKRELEEKLGTLNK